MTSLVVPAKELHKLHQEAERKYLRGQRQYPAAYPSAIHDIYVRTYVEAVVVERERRANEEAK